MELNVLIAFLKHLNTNFRILSTDTSENRKSVLNITRTLFKKYSKYLTST